jgi:methanogenic corrinoid protein MtbC1
MNLLFYDSDEKINLIAKKVFDKQFSMDPLMNNEYDLRRKKLMFDDILFNLEWLNTAILLDEANIFVDYSIWIYQLLCNLMKDLSRERIKDQMVVHYRLLADALQDTLPADQAEKAKQLLDRAITTTEKEAVRFTDSNRFISGNFVADKRIYLDFLLNNNNRGAMHYIGQKVKSGVDLSAIYIEIIQEVMYEVGNLWHQNKMTVDKEHYCTAVTQGVLSQFYPTIFSSPRIGKKVLACCVGTELHEMGVRMLVDIFEYNGWDSIYLGAAVPKPAILHAIQENQPDLVALSVTMPHHLPQCLDTATEIRVRFPDIKIAVGGRAFQIADQMWKKWNVDISTDNAVQLVQWANANV